jgi:hypothetical protein
MLAGLDRVLVCLPERDPFVPLLEAAARIAAALGVATVDTVAAPEHDLHASGRGLIPRLFGHRAGDIHLTWSAAQTAELAARLADHRSLVVACPRDARHLSKRTPAAVLAESAVVGGRSVLTVVDPDRDTPAVVMSAVVMAACRDLRRVIACFPWYDEAAIASDDAEARAIAERQEKLAIFLARIPTSDVVVEPCVVFSPIRRRSACRLAIEHDAAIVVATEWLDVNRPILVLPPAVACRPRPPSRLAALWAHFLDGPLRA